MGELQYMYSSVAHNHINILMYIHTSIDSCKEDFVTHRLQYWQLTEQ